MITVEIDLTGTDRTATTILVATVTTATTAPILEIHALFARNQIAVYGSIRQRNKRQKRLDLRLKTLVDLEPATPVTSTNALLLPIYSMWPKSKVKTIQVRMN
jgi:hypothetical protein